MKKYLYLLLLLILILRQTQAQNYPVLATPLLQPPYSLDLQDYQGPASKLKVQLLLRDLTKPSLEVNISLRLSGFGLELQTNPAVAALHTFVLQPGVPLTISGSELSPLFAQMQAQGLNYDDLLAGASLPGGYYIWEVMAYLPDGRQVSNTGRASMSVFKAQPPQITFPAHNASIAVSGITTIPFQWISRSVTPASVLGTIYDMKIYELPDEVTEPNVAVLSGLLPVFNTQTASSSYFYGPGDPLLIPGRRYAVVVQAQDLGGGDSFENQGLSQVVAFRISGEPDPTTQAACPSPTGLSIRQDDDQTIEVSWNPVAEATDYLLQFRKANEPWQSQVTTDNGLMLIQLSPAKYEVQVAARCTGGLLSNISPIATYDLITEVESTQDEVEDPITYYYEDEETPEPTEYEEPEEEAKDPLDDLILTVTFTDTTGQQRTYASLPPNPSTEQLKQATVAIKPKCVALSTGYSCGVHDNPAAPSGAEYMPKAGDELAMGSTLMEVVKIDGSGNGLGIAKVKAFNNAKFGVEFKGIKVKEGGCIYAGEAVTKSLDFAFLSSTQREELEKYYAVFNTLLTAVDSLAPEIAKGMNTMLDALKSKKAATRALLEENDIAKLPQILTNCTDIATQSQAIQDSLHKLYCGLQAGTIKGYKKDEIKAAIDTNIAFMNKLGPALNECDAANNFTPWSEKSCNGPCNFEWARYVFNEDCIAKIQQVFGINQSKLYDYQNTKTFSNLPDELKNLPSDENKLYKNVCGEYLPLIKLVFDPNSKNEFSSLKYRYVPPKGFKKFSECFESETEMYQYLTFRLLKNSCATGVVNCPKSYLDYDYIVAMSQIRTVIKSTESMGGLDGAAWQQAKEGLFTRLLTGNNNQQSDAVNYIKNFKFGVGLRYTSNIVGTLMMPVTAEDVVGSLVIKLFSRGAVKVSSRVANYFGKKFVQGAGRLLDNALIAELKALGTAFDESKLIGLIKNSEGKIVWLDKGLTTAEAQAISATRKPAGLAHVIEEHGTDFLNKGISEPELPEFLLKAAKDNNIVDKIGSTSRPVFETTFKGVKQRVTITISNNGYIVGANPISF